MFLHLESSKLFLEWHLFKWDLGNISKPFFPSHYHKFYLFISLCVLLFGFFFLCSFFFLKFLWSSLSLLSLIELANNMVKLSQHCESWDKNLVDWLIWHWHITRVEKFNGDVIITSHYEACCIWMSLNVCISIMVVQTTFF